MGKATLTIAIGGEYTGSAAMKKAEAELKGLRQAARDAGGATGDITKLGDAFVDLGSNMEVTGQRVTDIGSKLTKAAAPIAAVGAVSVKMAADYENAVAKVYTIMDKNVMTTEAMSKSILDLSTNTGKSATELADAAYQALSASVATDKVAGFVETSVNLAKAGFTSTTSAVDALTTVINAYGMEAEDAAEISDKLVQTQNKGKTTVDELAGSMGQIIPTAAALNVNLDNVLTSYAVMTKQGLTTSDATTALRSTLSELSNEGSTVAKILQEKTGKSFGQLMADGKNLGEILDILYQSVDGDGEAFKNLWGNVRAGTGALAIANAGTGEYSRTLKEMANSTGLVDKALDDLATPAAKASKAINAVKNTGIQLGEEIIGAAVPSLEKLSEMAQDLYKWFSELDEGTKQNIVKFGALAVAAGPAITAFGKLYGGVGSLISSLGKGMQKIGMFGAAMKAAEAGMRDAGAATVTLGDKLKGAADKTGLMTKATGLLKGSLAMLGVGAAIAGIGLLIDVLRDWKEHTDQVELATTGMEKALANAQQAYDAMRPSVEGATKALENNAISAEDALKSQAELAKSMGETWKDVGTNAAMVDNYAQTIQELGGKGELTKEELVRLQNAVDGFNQLTGSSIEVTNDLTGELNTSKEAILGVAEAYKEEAKAAAAKEMLVEVNKQMIQDEMALKKAKDALASAEEQYQTALREYPDSAFAYGQAVNEAQREVDEMSAALESAKRTEQDLVSVMSQSPTHFKTMEDALASCGTSIEGLGNVTDEQLASMKANFDGTLQSIYDTCVEQGVNIPDGLAQGIESSRGKPTASVEGVVNDAIEKVKSLLESHSPSQVMYRIGTDVDAGLSEGIDDSRSRPTSSMASLASAVVRAASGLPGDATRLGADSGSGMAGGISSKSSEVTMSATGVARSARSGLGSVDTYNTGSSFASGFANGMSGVDVWGAAYNIGMSALNAIKWALGIASPSKEAAKVGEWFGQGAVVGMESTEQAIAAESSRLAELMGLSPDPYGSLQPAQWQGASNRGANMAPSYVTMNVTVNVNAGSAPEARAAGTSLAEALYEELSRKMGSSLWPVSYSTA